MGVVTYVSRVCQDALVSAVIAGHVGRVEQALAHGGDPNQSDALGDTPVLWAAALGHAEVLLVLLNHGGHIDAINGQGDTLLHAAAREGKTVILVNHIDSATPSEMPNKLGQTLWSLVLSQPAVGPVLAVASLAAAPAWSPTQASCRLTEALGHSEMAVTAVLDAGGALGWDTKNTHGDRPWDLIRVRLDLAQRFRPEGAPVLSFHRPRQR